MNEDKEQFPLPLFDDLTEDDIKAIVGPTTAKKLAFLSIRKQLEYLVRNKFPVPDRLEKEQWSKMLALSEQESRNRYWLLLWRIQQNGKEEEGYDDDQCGQASPWEPLPATEEEGYQEILEEDKKMAKPLVFTEEIFADIVDSQKNVKDLPE